MVQAEQQVPRVPLGRTGMNASILGMGCSPLGHSYGVGPLLKAKFQNQQAVCNTRSCITAFNSPLGVTGRTRSYTVLRCRFAELPISDTSAEAMACVGTTFLGVVFLQEADEQTAIQTVHAAYAAGINFFDVSPFYGSGRAEKVSERHRLLARQAALKQQLHWPGRTL
jgi:hypothetical protein